MERMDTMEDLIHELLERLCGILEAKWHNHKLEKSQRGNDSFLGMSSGATRSSLEKMVAPCKDEEKSWI